jgi:hypothetical protein
MLASTAPGAPTLNADLVLPRPVQAYLSGVALTVADSLLITVDEHWNYVTHHGELARFNLGDTPTEELSGLLKVLCMGLPRVRGAQLKHVGLPNGRFVDLHLFSAKNRVHVLLLDVREEIEKTRVWQQSAQETELKSYEKTREIRKQRTSVASLRAERDVLRWALALSVARAGLLRHELFAAASNAAELASALERGERHSAPARTAHFCTLEDVAKALEKLVIGQISLTRNSADMRPLYAEPRALANALLPILMFAHRRAGVSTPHLSAVLAHENDALLLTAHCGAADLSTKESALLWEHKLPNFQPQTQQSGSPTAPTRGMSALSLTREFSPSDLALVLCADRTQGMAARITRQFESPENCAAQTLQTAAGLKLCLSIPLPKAANAPISAWAAAPRTRLALAVGAQCWLITQDNALAQIAATAVESRGLRLEHYPALDGLLARLSDKGGNRPGAVLLDPTIAGAGKFAFSARSAGFAGLLIALRPMQTGAAIAAAFDATAATVSASAIVAALFD